jgi:hypothetical protein
MDFSFVGIIEAKIQKLLRFVAHSGSLVFHNRSGSLVFIKLEICLRGERMLGTSLGLA